MLENEILSWISQTVSGCYQKSKIDISLQALEQVLEMDPEPPLFSTHIRNMTNAADLAKVDMLKEFTDIERFMKVLCKIINPNKMRKPPRPLYPGDGNNKWMLANLYKEAFQIVDFDFNLTAAGRNLDRYENAPNYLYHYIYIYWFRNENTHDILSMSISEVQKVVRSMLIVELDLCYRQREAIEKKYSAMKRKQCFSGSAFTQRIQAEYKELETKGFGYVDMHWISNEEKVDCSVENLAANTEWNIIKILGEAGSGKSTALKRLEYLLAKQYSNANKTVVPIFVELYTLTDADRILLEKIAGIMHIEVSIAEEFMENGEVCLLLDGFNEILDISVKKKVAKELDSFARNYPGVRIFLTDRAIARASIPTVNVAKRMHLRPITNEDRKSYYEKNCSDKECLQLLLNKLDECPEYFEFMNTPLKLKQLSEIVTFRKELPDDITVDYINYLLEREANEKKDENIEYLPTFLQSLAIIEKEEIPFLMAVAQLAKCKAALGFSIPDTNQCLKLAIDMGILICEENNMVSFASVEYHDYFFMEGLSNGLDQFLQ